MVLADAAELRRAFPGGPDPRIDELEVFAELGSTNSYLLTQPAPAAGRCRIAIADHQTAGRGRPGRRWRSPPGSGVCLSLAYTFGRRPRNLHSVTLVAGVAGATALRRLGVEGIRLKWPNDIFARDAKLGGILAEARGGNGPAATVVIGVGVNVNLAGIGHDAIAPDRQAAIVDLASLTDAPPSRTALYAAIIDALLDVLPRFEAHGFEAFRAAWLELDWLRGRAVQLDCAGRRVEGTGAGIDEDGALLLQSAGRVQRIVSGTVLLPAAACGAA